MWKSEEIVQTPETPGYPGVFIAMVVWCFGGDVMFSGVEFTVH